MQLLTVVKLLVATAVHADPDATKKAAEAANGGAAGEAGGAAGNRGMEPTGDVRLPSLERILAERDPSWNPLGFHSSGRVERTSIRQREDLGNTNTSNGNGITNCNSNREATEEESGNRHTLMCKTAGL